MVSEAPGTPVPSEALSLVRGAYQPWNASTVGEALARTARLHPDRVALVHAERSVTYARLAETVGDVARRLATAGVQHRDPVALLVDNDLRWVTSFLAAAVVGAPVIPVNPRSTPAEIRHLLHHSRAAALVAGETFGRSAALDLLTETGLLDDRDAFPDLRTLLRIGEGAPIPGVKQLDDIAASGPVHTATRPDDTVIVQYTSGTTGSPKGVLLSHDQTLRNAWQVGTRLGLRPTDTMYSPMPFCHVGGAVLSLLFTLQRGATLVFPDRFDPERMLRAIDRYRCTVTAGVETMLLGLIEEAPSAGYSGRSVRAGWGAGPDGIFDLIPGFVNIYGMSEASPNAAMSFFDEPVEVRRDTCGFVQDGIELGIVDPEGGWVSRGTTGEIRIRGWSVMTGYLDDPDATAATIDGDGWLHTGDLGTIGEDDRVSFVGRLKDTIRVGGEIVAAREIERVLEDHDRVRAAHVVAIPDERLGEVPLAFIETADGRWDDTLEAELMSLATRVLARFKVPRAFRHCTNVAVTASGKVQKRLLVDRYLMEANR